MASFRGFYSSSIKLEQLFAFRADLFWVNFFETVIQFILPDGSVELGPSTHARRHWPVNASVMSVYLY
jgi:hypothetical protein